MLSFPRMDFDDSHNEVVDSPHKYIYVSERQSVQPLKTWISDDCFGGPVPGLCRDTGQSRGIGRSHDIALDCGPGNRVPESWICLFLTFPYGTTAHEICLYFGAVLCATSSCCKTWFRCRVVCPVVN